MGIEEIVEEATERAERVWDGDIGKSDAGLLGDGVTLYIGMTEEIQGKKFPILVDNSEEHPADGEIIDNGMFEDILSYEVDFDVSIPEAVEREFDRIREEA